MKLFTKFKQDFKHTKQVVFTLEDYLKKCKTDPLYYASSAERMLKSIGEPELIYTRDDERLSRIFYNRVIKTYPAFSEFYGMEETIESIVSYFKHAAQGLEEKKQILYLLGPVGGGKSSLAEKLKQLMEQYPFYVLAVEHDDGEIELSPVLETPLGLFDPDKYADSIKKEYGIPKRYMSGLVSPWATKRLNDIFKGDISKFKVVQVSPSKLNQAGITKTEPGDENNQDITETVR